MGATHKGGAGARPACGADALGFAGGFLMPSSIRKRLGKASTARQAGQGSTIFDSRACGPALPGGYFVYTTPGG